VLAAQEPPSCSKGSVSSSSSYLEKQQQLLQQGPGRGVDDGVGSLSAGLNHLGLTSEASEDLLSMSQVYDDQADEGEDLDNIAQALPLLKQQIIDLVSGGEYGTVLLRDLCSNCLQ
jgi:hypothetical protein